MNICLERSIKRTEQLLKEKRRDDADLFYAPHSAGHCGDTQNTAVNSRGYGGTQRVVCGVPCTIRQGKAVLEAVRTMLTGKSPCHWIVNTRPCMFTYVCKAQRFQTQVRYFGRRRESLTPNTPDC